nr:TonB-dependent receptor plug domain-containing protein [Dysgonomonas sp. BGC7]
MLPEYDLWGVTDKAGTFTIKNISKGNTKIVIQCLGMVTVSQSIVVDSSTSRNFYMEQNSLRLKEVEVTAKERQEGAVPVTTISRSAMDHIQATSLNDVLNLLPGAVPTNQSLAGVSNAVLRNYEDGKVNSTAAIKSVNAMNSMGTSIIMDNAPISNNANLQILNTATAGNNANFETSAGSGIDLRQISTDNIESIDVIKGIASVQYGDVTSGAVIIRSKAGKSPLQVRFKVNPNITQTSLTGGYKLGEKSGNLNISLDYAHSTDKQTVALETYDRYTTKFLYSNTLFDKLRTNTSLDIIYSKDNKKQDEDDIKNKVKKSATNQGFRFNTNGVYQFNKEWFKSIHYTFSTSYTDREGFYQTMVSNASNIISTAMSDGTVVTNRPGQSINDVDGKPITQWSEGDKNAYNIFLPYEYLMHYNIDGKEWNTFLSTRATFANSVGEIAKNRFFVGGDYRSEGNNGKGKTYDQSTPPVSNNTRAIRMRSFKDIPFIKQLGLFIEENLNLNINGHDLNFQAGLRYDKQKEIKGEISPRLNASFEIIKKKLFIRGGYGHVVKSLPLTYLYPETAYFDLQNYTNANNPAVAPEDYLHITTTRAFSARNKDLKLAKSKKAEIGIDLSLGNKSLHITAYQDKMNNGYGFGTAISRIEYTKYTNTGAGLAASTQNLFLAYNSPQNNIASETKGFDFDLDLGRFDAIRTSFILNGGYIKNTTYSSQEFYYNNNITNPSYIKNIGVYEAKAEKSQRDRFVTTLRLVHNIPEIGFVISLSATTTWINKDKNILGNDSIPVAYISLSDGKRYDFDPDKISDPKFSDIKRTVAPSRHIKESLPILWCFNMNLTKEIGQNINVSFFANNIFSYNPRIKSKRYGNYDQFNPPIFFGLELSAKIPW